jgi:hypothetical protein
MNKKLVTITPVQFNDWIVQASVLDNDSICVIVYHRNNLRCFVQFFDDEEKANIFVRSIIYQDHTLFTPPELDK